MSDETTLLPCPFCGGEADISDEGPGTEPERYWVFCANGRCFVEGTPAFTTEAEAIAAWNTRAATTIGKVQVEIEPVSRGTLTAEQVSEAAYAHSIHADCADADWQAIADELNAELVSGTCDWIPFCDWIWECSNCGERHHENDARKYKHCPGCGAKCSGKVMSA